MQVQILALPPFISAMNLNCLKPGDIFDLYRETPGVDADNHWFTFGPRNEFEANLDDLVINGIEFKVIKVAHEKA